MNCTGFSMWRVGTTCVLTTCLIIMDEFLDDILTVSHDFGSVMMSRQHPLASLSELERAVRQC